MSYRIEGYLTEETVESWVTKQISLRRNLIEISKSGDDKICSDDFYNVLLFSTDDLALISKVFRVEPTVFEYVKPDEPTTYNIKLNILGFTFNTWEYSKKTMEDLINERFFSHKI